MEEIGEDYGFFVMFNCALIWPVIVCIALYKVYKKAKLDQVVDEKEDK